MMFLCQQDCWTMWSVSPTPQWLHRLTERSNWWKMIWENLTNYSNNFYYCLKFISLPFIDMRESVRMTWLMTLMKSDYEDNINPFLVFAEPLLTPIILLSFQVAIHGPHFNRKARDGFKSYCMKILQSYKHFRFVSLKQYKWLMILNYSIINVYTFFIKR